MDDAFDVIVIGGGPAGENAADISNLIGAGTWVVDPKINSVEANNTLQHQFIQIFVNAFYSFAKNAEVGIEYAFGQWTSFCGKNTPQLKGLENRVNFSLHYSFF